MCEQNICPVCRQKRDKLVSLRSTNERFHGITVSRDHRYVDKICFSCRNKAEKELKKKGSAILIGDDFSILVFGYLKYLDKIKRYLKLPKDFYDQAINFIKHVFLKWEINIPNEDKLRYYFAGIIMLLQEKQMNEKEELMIKFIKKNYTNILIDDLNDAIKEIKNWCKDHGNFKPFSINQ